MREENGGPRWTETVDARRAARRSRYPALWSWHDGGGPLVAVALHDGHQVRREVEELLAPDRATRRREEDPYTGLWTRVAPSRLIAARSRFEFDLNREPERAVYRRPEDAWGLTVWRQEPPAAVIERSRALHATFYAFMAEELDRIEARHGRFVVLDLHTYNYRRHGPDGPEADPELNPQVDVGISEPHRDLWSDLIDRFEEELRRGDFPGGRLDVRENVKFPIGPFGEWVHERYPESGCVLSVEFKKFFMDEWTGEVEPALLGAIEEALVATVPGILAELEASGGR